MDRVRVWFLLTVLGVVAGCAVLLTGEELSSLEETARWLGRWAVGAAIVSAVAVAAWAAVAGALRRRAAQRDVIVQDLTSAAVSVTGSHPGGHTVRVTRWSKRLPRRIVVRYPKKHDPHGASGRLAAAITDAAPKGASPRGWHAQHVPLMHRYVLTPKPDLDEESNDREEAEHRAVQLVKKTVPGCKSVTIPEWSEAQNPSRIAARFEPSPRLSSDRLQAAVVRVVSNSFPGRWVAEWDHEHDRVVFKVRQELPGNIPRPMDVPTRTDRLVLRYGQAEDGTVQEWDLDGTKPHALVVGPTGGGKTFCLRAMALDGISQGMTVYGLDPKRIELMGLIGVPGVAEIATDPETMEDMIYRMRKIMDERYRMIEKRKTTRKQLEPILFILDEFFILRMFLNKEWQDDPDTKGKVNPVLDEVAALLALSRSARIHCVIGIQRPDVEFLGDGAARDNTGHRVALGAVSAQGSDMMFETRDAGLDLPDVPGRATASGPRGPHEVQVWALPDPDPYLDGTRTEDEQRLLDSLLAGAPKIEGAQQPTYTPRPDPVPDDARALVDSEPAEIATEPEAERVDSEPVETGMPGDVGWSEVPAEQLVAGDVIRLEGEEEPVLLVDADFDPMDEECVCLEWAGGSVSLPSSEPVWRADDVPEDRAA